MSKISFDSGDYQKQLDKGSTQNGLLYFNPANRDIAIGGLESFTNFNTMMINDNQQVSDNSNYTITSQCVSDKYLIIENNSLNYYSVSKALDIIGDTDNSMTNGYLKQQLATLIDGITYESTFDFTIKSNVWQDTLDVHQRYVYETTKTYTIHCPRNVNKQFNAVIIFTYVADTSPIQLMPTIRHVVDNQDVEISYQQSDYNTFPNVNETIYKAFWI